MISTVFYNNGDSNKVDLDMVALSNRLWERVSFTMKGDVADEYEFVNDEWKVKSSNKKEY